MKYTILYTKCRSNVLIPVSLSVMFGHYEVDGLCSSDTEQRNAEEK